MRGINEGTKRMQNILTLETNKYSIKLNNFEGPLDLLCHLIDKNKMDIYDINLSEITDQYIEYIRQMEQINLEVTSEFLVMSSTLLCLKSRHLLPKNQEDEEEITQCNSFSCHGGNSACRMRREQLIHR